MNEGIPKDLIYASKDLTQAKLANFRQAGADKLHLVFDFDRTLTVARPGLNDDVTTWHILKQHLPQAGQERYHQLFTAHRALELDGTMSVDQAAAWWSEILSLYIAYGVNIFEVEQDFIHKATIRPYAKEIFDMCAAKNIPTMILSAGIKDVIEIWARAYGIKPTVIHSTSLQIGSDGVIQGWNKNSLVHVLNKKEKGGGHDGIAAIRRQRPLTILVGDSLADAHMAEGNEAVFRILILDLRGDEKASKAAVKERALEQFDAVIETGSMRPVLQLLAHLCK